MWMSFIIKKFYVHSDLSHFVSHSFLLLISHVYQHLIQIQQMKQFHQI